MHVREVTPNSDRPPTPSPQVLAEPKRVAEPSSSLPEWGMPTLGQPGCKTAERDSASSYSSRMVAMVLGLVALRPGPGKSQQGSPQRSPSRRIVNCDSPASDRSWEPAAASFLKS
jgi:hypothetical protein